jgi:hypothetical protein
MVTPRTSPPVSQVANPSGWLECISSRVETLRSSMSAFTTSLSSIQHLIAFAVTRTRKRYHRLFSYLT